jgi:D-glycero-D-manno-heptose 1,7-bisphosphate phosphatase
VPVLVLDRDGVINEDSDEYIKELSEWHPIPGSIEAICRLSRAGFSIAVATNQSGLGRGYFGLDELEAIHQHLCQLVEEGGGRIDGIFYCPHLPDAGCNCRKPATGLLRAIEEELDQPLAGSYFIGDSLKDLQAARAYGCRPVLVRTGKGAGTAEQLRSLKVDLEHPGDIPIYDDLAAAAQAILDDH